MYEPGETRADFNRRFGQPVPDPPIAFQETQYFEALFYNLNNQRVSNGYSLNPVSFSEIEAFQRVTGEHLTRDEVLMLLNLVSVYDSSMEENKPRKGADE